MRRATRHLLALGAVIVVMPSPARAATCIAPPGTAAIDQYCEQVVAPKGKGDGSGSGPATIPNRGLRELKGSGEDGERLVRTVGPFKPGRRADQAERAAVVAPSEGALGGVRRAISQGLTVDARFVLFLLALLTALAGWAWSSRRARS